MENSAQVVTIKLGPKTIRKLILWGLIALAVLGLIALLPALQSVITTLVIALFLAFLLDPVVNFIENRGLERWFAAVLVFLMLFMMAAVAFKFLVPVVSNEVQQLSSGLHDDSGGDMLQKFQEKLGDSVPLLNNPMLQKEIRTKIDAVLKKSFSMVVNVVSTVVSLVMMAFITFFLLKDGRRMKKAVVSWVPNRYFEMSLIILHKISSQLGKYIRGQLLVASIVGALSILALYLLHVRYFFFIGALAGVANMIPYFGPLVGAIPAVIIAFIDTGSFGAVAAVAVAFASIQLFENIFVSPFIVSKSVELHPLTIIIVILIGGQLLGLFGMLLAVPTASIIKVTAQEISWGVKNYRIL